MLRLAEIWAQPWQRRGLIALILVALYGVAGFLLWQQWGLGGLIYSVAPGIGAGFLTYVLGRVASARRMGKA